MFVAHWLWDRFIRKRLPLIGLAVVFMVLEAAMLKGPSATLVQPICLTMSFWSRGANGPRVVFVALAMAFGVLSGVAWRGLRINPSWPDCRKRPRRNCKAVLLAHLATLDQAFFQAQCARCSDRAGARRFRSHAPPVSKGLSPGWGVMVPSVVVLLGVALWTAWQWTLAAIIAIPLIRAADFGPFNG